MSAAWTPGPWFYGDEDESVVGVHYVDIHAGEYGDRSYRCIASAEGPFDGGDFLPLDEESRANARLIAAAPELYEALRKCLAMVNCHCKPDARAVLAEGGEPFSATDAHNAAVSALRKARPESSL